MTELKKQKGNTEMLKTQKDLKKAKKAIQSCDETYEKYMLARWEYQTASANLRSIQRSCLLNHDHNWSKLDDNNRPEEGSECKDCGFIFGP